MRRHRFVPRPILFCLALACLATIALPARAQAEGDLPADFLSALSYRFVGPVGNRVAAVVGVPGEPNVYFAGAASGGIFKSDNGGSRWRPVFDDQDVSSIGALAVAPSDPNVVWAGTGEAFLRANISLGTGIYRSTDGGDTWEHKGLEDTGRIGRIVIDPRDPDVVFAAALGHCYGPQEERGVFRTRDGGDTWERVLFVDEHTGASDLVMDPNNPRVLFAGMWQIRIWPWARESGGPGSGLWTSRDGGDTWNELKGAGLPEKPLGKIGLAMSAANSGKVYALIETSTNNDFAPVDDFQGVLWRSDDGGASWTMVNADNTLVQRPLYYSRATVSPDDADEVHFLAVQHSRSLDGGATIRPNNSGYDHHDLWIDPANPDRMISGHDGGVSLSTDRGKTWFRPQLPIAQMYHVAVDRQIPYNLYGNRQDGSTMRGPSNSLRPGPIPIGAWQSVGGCETGFALPDPSDPNIVWSGCYDGILDRFDQRSGVSRNVSVWPVAVESWAAEDLRYRWQWTFPIAISPHDPKVVYVGSQHVHRTRDEGQSWEVISPDLTTDDPELQRRTGGLTLDDAGPTIAPALFALIESPVEKGLIWAGSNDGQIQLTRDGGESWTNVTPSAGLVPTLGTISNIDASRHAAGTAYVTVDRHQLGDTEPYVLRTRDYGATWRRIDADVPRGHLSYAHCVREDPVRPGLLYLGTENELYVSLDDGGSWRPLDTGLPPAPVHWIEVQDHFNDLVVATYGRGFWILDDLTPLHRLSSEHAELPAYLFPPRPAYRFRSRAQVMQQPDDPVAGSNPIYGASIHYTVGPPPEEGTESEGEEATRRGEGLGTVAEGDVSIAIRDAQGTEVRLLEDLPASPGLHRVHWDLRFEESEEVRLRTKPDENSRVPVPEEGHRPLGDGGTLSLLAPPGQYTVELRIGDASWSHPLEVRKDPGSGGTEGEIAEQHALLQEIWDDLDLAARRINDIEWARKQLGDLHARLKDYLTEPDEVLDEAAGELITALKEIESRFFDLRLTGAGQDSLRWQRRIYSRLGWLAGGIASSDRRPTDQQVEVHQLLRGQLREALDDLETLRLDRLAAFNQLLEERSLGQILLPAANE